MSVDLAFGRGLAFALWESQLREIAVVEAIPDAALQGTCPRGQTRPLTFDEGVQRVQHDRLAYNLNINGRSLTVEADGDTPLLWALRDILGLKGTKFAVV